MCGVSDCGSVFNQTKKSRRRAVGIFSFGLSVQDQLGQLYGIYDLVALVDAHIAGSDLIDEDDFTGLAVAELKLDVPQVKSDGLQVIGNDLGDLEGLLLHALEHGRGHDAKGCQTLAGYQRVALFVVLEGALNITALKRSAVLDVFAVAADEAGD